MKFSSMALMGVSVCLPLMAGCFYGPRRGVIVEEHRPVYYREPGPVVVERPPVVEVRPPGPPVIEVRPGGRR